MQAFWAPKGVMVPDNPSVDRGNWGRVTQHLFALHERRIIQNAVFCEESFGKNYALYVHHMYKNEDRFKTGRSTNYIALKACQVGKVYASPVLKDIR